MEIAMNYTWAVTSVFQIVKPKVKATPKKQSKVQAYGTIRKNTYGKNIYVSTIKCSPTYDLFSEGSHGVQVLMDHGLKGPC